MTNVRQIYEYLDCLAPFATQEAWDNSGLLLGRLDKSVRRVLLCVDLTAQTAARAVAEQADLVLTHHPPIFHPISSIPGTAVYYPLLTADIALIAAHTNLDRAPGCGVNTALCDLLELERVGIEPERGVSPYVSLCACAELSPRALARRVGAKLRSSPVRNPAVRLLDLEKPVRRVAVCAGAGGEFVQDAGRLGAELLLTGEAKHNELVEARNLGLSVLMVGHHASEAPVLPCLAERLLALDPALEALVEMAGGECAVL